MTAIRTDDYHGELTLSEGNQVLHRESVGLSYGAIFGPDVADVVAGQRPRSSSPSKPSYTTCQVHACWTVFSEFVSLPATIPSMRVVD